MDTLKVNPQKRFVENICKSLYYLGMGSCWYEDVYQSTLWKLFYNLWMVLANSYNIAAIVNVVMACFRSDLDENEQNDLVQFIIAYTVIMAKIFFLFWNRGSVKVFLVRLLEPGFGVVTADLAAASVRRAVKICVAISACAYWTMLVATVDGIRAHINYGVPIRTEVTYYPPASASGVAINMLRFFIQLHWWFAVSIMVGIDSLCISSLVIVGYKFKVLQVYFSDLRKKVFRNASTMPRNELQQEFKNDLVVGIKMHEDALWCARNVQTALGNLYSVQVFESVVLIVMCLIKLVSTERGPTFLVANMSYISCLILLTGSYMLPAGHITYQASMVPTWMFHCGWEAAGSREARVLCGLALQRGQVPVQMTAFGILTLSYSNFISVIRSSYSFFAVMY